MNIIIIFILIILISFLKPCEYFTEAQRYFPSRCTNLSFNKCLQTSECGWLIDGNSRCLPGTPIGPLNPKLQPDAEYSPKGNIQYSRWTYAQPNPFIFC